MIRLNYFFILPIVLLLFLGCSKDDEEEANLIVFKNLTASKELSFTDSLITINIDGSGYSESIVTSNSLVDVTITKVNKNTYTVKASKAGEVKINVEIKNGNYGETKSIFLSFYEHGIKNYKIIEGIEINVDKTDKVSALLGEPDLITSSSNKLYDVWYYLSKGFFFYIHKTSKIVAQSRVYGIDWGLKVNGKEEKGLHYPYEIGNSLKIANGQTLMDDAIKALGGIYKKEEGSTRYYYLYERGVVLYFSSNSIDEYVGKPVDYIDLY